MKITNQFLADNSINRGLMQDGKVFVFTGDGGYASTDDATVLKNLLDAGGVAISKNLFDNQSYGEPQPLTSDNTDIGTDVDGKNITRKSVYNILPWLSKFGGADADKLVDAYVKGFIESDGESTAALAEMRFGEGSDAYNRVFINIVDPDTGALRMTETEYLAGLEDFNTILTQNNLAGYAATLGKEKYATLVSLDVAMPEFAKRVKEIKGVLDMVDEELKAATIATYNDYFASQGITAGLDESGLLALAFDPNLNSDILNRRINSAEMGALYEGVTEQQLGLGTVQKLIGAGVKVGQAEKQFEVAALSARLLSSAARRQRRATTLSAENVLEASVLGEQDMVSVIQSIQNQLASASSAALGATKSNTGQVTGLTEI
tara:strand:- start:120 stop:1250 length:1131 start_codon:yes stop_codon:yes gene_type:complete